MNASSKAWTVSLLALCLSGIVTGSGRAASVELVRDWYGMPHIFSASEEAGMYVFGEAQAQDRLESILRNYKQARGESAELDGAALLEGDVQVRAFRLREIAESKYQTLSPQTRRDICAFCAGINDFEEKHPKKCPTWSFRVDLLDVITFAEFVNLSFASDPEQEMPHAESAWLSEWDHPRNRITDPFLMGSNAFAVGPAKTEECGETILSMDPHLPWHGFLQWYEAHLACGKLNVSGVTFAGLPFIVMGHNKHVAWANTVNQPDLSDVYEERLTPNNHPTEYIYDGKVKRLKAENFLFKVKQGNGSLSRVTRTINYTRHGPILVMTRGHTYAIRKADWGDVGALDQFRAQDLAVSVADYRKAISGCHVVMFNHIITDDRGHIGYIYGGHIPVRPTGYDFHRPVPGWTKSTEWLRPMTIDDLPQMSDPPSGFLDNCNGAPYYVSDSGKLKCRYGSHNYPNWLTADFQTDRGRRMTELLSSDGAVSTERARLIATDTQDLLAKQIVPLLLRTLKRAPVKTGEDGDLLNESVKSLSNWNLNRDPDECGAALFDVWTKQHIVRDLLNSPDPADAYVDPAAISKSLVDATRFLQSRHDGLKTTWGDLHRHRSGAIDLPMAGGGDCITPNNGPSDVNGIVIADFGPSYRMLVEFRHKQVQAWSYLPYGESNDPTSLHSTDQMSLAASCLYRPVLFIRSQVERSGIVSRMFKLPQYSK